jgi:hypothetical protein
MIHPPRRSVTRFFIPLIDVLTLLFCIFLVMPLARDAREASAKDQLKASAGDRNALEAEVKRLREKIDELEGRGGGKPEWANVRTIEFNNDTGERYYFKGRQRVPLGKSDDANGAKLIRDMVDEDRRLVGSRRKLNYTVQIPRRDDLRHPNQKDLNDLEKEIIAAGASFGVEGELKKKEGGP